MHYSATLNLYTILPTLLPNHLFDCSRINQASNTIALIISKIKNKNIYLQKNAIHTPAAL